MQVQCTKQRAEEKNQGKNVRSFNFVFATKNVSVAGIYRDRYDIKWWSLSYQFCPICLCTEIYMTIKCLLCILRVRSYSPCTTATVPQTRD